MEESQFSESQKETFKKKSSAERNTFYTSTKFWYDLYDTKLAVNEFHNFYILNSIFLSQDLKKEFKEIDKLLSSSLINREIGEREKEYGGSWNLISKSYEGLGTKVEKIVVRIEKLVQKRLEFNSVALMKNDN